MNSNHGHFHNAKSIIPDKNSNEEMNYRRKTANWQNKYNHLLDNNVAASVAVQ